MSEGLPPVARFRVSGSFALSARAMFVVAGQIVDGPIRSGQRVLEPAGIDAPVHGVEYLRLRPSSGRDERALTFIIPDADTLERWRALVQPGIEMLLGD